MRFPQYDYKEFNRTNKHEWPLDDWFKMMKDAHAYCKEITYIYDFEGKCRDSDLPSFHPYWKFETLKDTIKLIHGIRRQINEANLYIKNGGSHVFNAIAMNDRSRKTIANLLKEILPK